ncbi:phosphatidate cytidylyltransferase [Novosphingobium aquimarinum]|uniref:phosphatidate cytidylyltransferase n=1 Tax=Novosphingobium aquimarinum TaxID=2682494 RepID=UPI0018DE6D3C|nr:phosphatidate cytidylyltransferase [Novosphingobium aquimarinum]
MVDAERPRKRDRIKTYVTVPLSVRTSDLPRRAGSAVVMLAISGTALWLGGIVWTLFVAAVAIGVYFEWSVLVLLFREKGTRRNLWRVFGAIYCAIGAAVLIALRDSQAGIFSVLMLLGAVIGTDVFAYFSGRTFGGPKIAPRISPSKTWAGLIGGAFGASLVMWLLIVTMGEGNRVYIDWTVGGVLALLAAGSATAIVAQAGDFFESWMKRRAGVKDSGRLLPGHGGLFDRVDGLLSVSIAIGAVFMISRVIGAS